jgi:uncharacterized integral membrane protein (TIGR00698 family)
MKSGTLNLKLQVGQVLLPIAGLICLMPWMPSAGALLAGIALALTVGNPYVETTRRYFHYILTWSVMGLGAGMNLHTVAKVGLQGIGYTVVGITLTLGLGFLLSRWLRLERDIGVLISVGTAICGGSAIAAVAPTLRARPHAISVALGTVFLLNALALVLFPPIGHWLHLTQNQFGLWSALAIHDTSSVVGATLQYGPEALQVGTTVKLARALWIVPVTLGSSLLFSHGKTANGPKTKRPWFILGFVIAAAVVTWMPAAQPVGHLIETLAKRTLVLALFLIGANLTLSTLKTVGLKPFIQGVTLWLLVASTTLAAVLLGWLN